LESFKEDLSNDLTRATGGSLTNKPEDKVLSDKRTYCGKGLTS